jgi:signal transduction histidine kinase
MVLDERDRIARELHDGTIQSLYAVGLRLESAVCMADGVPEEVHSDTVEILAALRAAVAEMRKYVMNLKGSVAHQPLHQRLGYVVAEVQRNAAVPIEYRAASIPVGEYGETEANHVCQIVHEALSNALRHGEAKHIAVTLTRTANGVEVTVRDDGKGFVFTEQIEPDHHGLSNMRQRAQVLGGELRIHSVPGAGTQVQIRLPLREGAV